MTSGLPDLSMYSIVTLICTDKGRHRRTVLTRVYRADHVWWAMNGPRPGAFQRLDDPVVHLTCPRCTRRPRVNVVRLAAGLKEKDAEQVDEWPRIGREVDVSTLPF